VYIAHDWDITDPSYSYDLERLRRLNTQLRDSGLLTWFPAEHNSRGDIHVAIRTGLLNTCVVLFFITKRYRDKINKFIFSTRKSIEMVPNKDLGFYEFRKIQEFYGDKKEQFLLPVIFDSTMKYFSEGSKDGDIGNFFYGNSHFFDFNEFYFINEDLVPEEILLGGGSSGMEEPQPQYPRRYDPNASLLSSTSGSPSHKAGKRAGSPHKKDAEKKEFHGVVATMEILSDGMNFEKKCEMLGDRIKSVLYPPLKPMTQLQQTH
jgi:hypothetical protein